jgi:hypothetical protein
LLKNICQGNKRTKANSAEKKAFEMYFNPPRFALKDAERQKEITKTYKVIENTSITLEIFNIVVICPGVIPKSI